MLPAGGRATRPDRDPGRGPAASPRAERPFDPEVPVSHLITLEALDQDGAIRETAEAAGATRADFLKRGGVAGAGFLAGGVLFSGLVSPAEAAISTRRRSKANDVRIANYAPTPEYFESEFYLRA